MARDMYDDEVDVLLIGAGIMSATLGAMFHALEPEWSQVVYERLDGPAEESSYPFNNAGTGHSALCELNYTPEKNGRVDVSKAMAINEKFQLSRQFWSNQVENGVLKEPRAFINPVPHVSFAQGEDQIGYLRRRYDALSKNHMFPNMQFTDDREDFARMLPLMAQGRDFDAEPVAISWTDAGTDINYGALTRKYIDNAQRNGLEQVHFYRADLSKPLADAPWARSGFDAVLLDPPRDGALEIVRQMTQLQARRVVYVSCNPATLARDARELASQGFRLKRAGLLDMFPQTAHAEAMALFERD